MNAWSIKRFDASRRALLLRSSGSPLRNSVTRTMRSMSLSLMIAFSTRTAIRSIITPNIEDEIRRAMVGARRSISECLPDREEELEFTQPLRAWRAILRNSDRRSVTPNKILDGLVPVEPEIRRWVESIRQIDTNRAQGCLVPYSKSGGLYAVIEVLVAVLPVTKRDIPEIGVDVPHVVEHNATDVRA